VAALRGRAVNRVVARVVAGGFVASSRASLPVLAALAPAALASTACVSADSQPAAPSLGAARATSAPFDADAPDAPDASDADAPPPYACDSGLLDTFDLTRAPLTFGGTTPATWSIGKATILMGPPHDHRFVPDRSFLATHPGASYAPFEDGFAETPGPDLRSLPPRCPVTLHAWVWYEIEDLRDGANLLIAGPDAGASALGVAQGPSLYDTDDFQDIECATTACLVRGQSAWSSFAPGSTSWREATFDLTALAGRGGTHLRFQFHSDHYGEYQGIYVDDVTLTSP
jgi:hypothetical protein